MSPPEANAEFAAQREDVLDIYQLPYDPRYPQLAQPGQPTLDDYDYERNGVCNLFTISEPLAGWRHLAVTECRKATDYARQDPSILS